ncbi:hypothetical protein DFH27DRAFT_57470 [Peziza echinospora]|nr:hypothetical protein DFH27DRAFT_57470 [Peziza echinospora]
MMTNFNESTRQAVETSTPVVHPSGLLDTEIETAVCALGITEKSTSAEIMIEDAYPKQSIRETTSSPAICEKQAPQLFDFVHIRYQSPGIQDGTKIFRLAFDCGPPNFGISDELTRLLPRQTKPGGWIEVVETGPISPHARMQLTKASNLRDNSLRNARDARMSSRNSGATSETAIWIKRQLLEAGFVDVEEKGRRSTTISTAGICHKVANVGKYIKSWCLGFLGTRWNCDSSSTTPTSSSSYYSRGATDEKSSSAHVSSRIFVIARRP